MKKHFWLVAGQVIYVDGSGNRGDRNLNTLLQTSKQFITQAELGKCQQTLQVRFMRETFPNGEIPVDIKVIDVFMMGISHLGHMTEHEFTKGFDTLVKETERAQRDTAGEKALM